MVARQQILLVAATPIVVAQGVYAVWDAATITAVTLSGGNLVATNTGATSPDQGAKTVSAAGKTSGKYYFEVVYTTATGGGNVGFGVGTPASTYTGMGGSAATGVLTFRASGNIWANGVNTGSSLGTSGGGQLINGAVDLDNRSIWFRKSGGSWNGSGTANPATNIGGITIPAGTMIPFCTFGGSLGAAGNVMTANFGASAFTDLVPSGFTAGWPVVWIPADLGAALRGWYRADALAGADNTSIASWPDSSGLGNHATVNTAPTLQTAEQNGLNVVQFSAASSQWMSLPNLLSGASAAAAIMAVKTISPSSTTGAPLKLGSDVTLNGDNHYPWSDNNIYDDFGRTARIGFAAPAGLTSWHIGSYHSQNALWKYFKDGTEIHSTVTNTFGLTSTPRIAMGLRSGTGGSNPYNGMIGEIAIINAFLSDSDRQKLEGYLAHKWALAGSLPGGHPYKSAPP